MISRAGKVLVSEESIREKVEELGRRLTEDYRGEELLLVGILRGAAVFMSDLMRKVDLPCEIDFMEVSSYGAGTSSSGVVRILKDLQEEVEGRNVVIVEDIVDTGLTLHYLRRSLATRGPRTLEFCALLSKPSRREVGLDVRYQGFEVPDEFVIGYGIDYAGSYRNLPEIRALDPAEAR